MKRLAVCAALLAGVVGITAASLGSAAAKQSSSITISNEQGSTWTCGFNPFNATVVPFSFGTVYEPLTFSDPLESGRRRTGSRPATGGGRTTRPSRSRSAPA